jgi:hypothetical protein
VLTCITQQRTDVIMYTRRYDIVFTDGVKQAAVPFLLIRHMQAGAIQEPTASETAAGSNGQDQTVEVGDTPPGGKEGETKSAPGSPGGKPLGAVAAAARVYAVGDTVYVQVRAWAASRCLACLLLQRLWWCSVCVVTIVVAAVVVVAVL